MYLASNLASGQASSQANHSITLNLKSSKLKLTGLKNPNRQTGANQLAIYKCGRWVDLGSVEKQLQVWQVSAFLQDDVDRIFPWRYRHRLLVLLSMIFSTHSPKIDSKSQMAVDKALLSE